MEESKEVRLLALRRIEVMLRRFKVGGTERRLS